MSPPWNEPVQPLSRRAFCGTVLATALGSSAVAASISRSQPRLLVVGDDAWQTAVLLAARARVLILVGDMTAEGVQSIPMLMSAMRQRIDVVIGSAACLRVLPPGFHQRWQVQRTILSAADTDAWTSPSLTDHTVYLPGDVHLSTSSAGFPAGNLLNDRTGGTLTGAGIVTISLGPIAVAIGSDLESLSRLARPSVAMVIAPTGSIDGCARYLATPAIGINAGVARDQEIKQAGDSGSHQDTRSLVRIFPEDVAEFRLSPAGVTLPGWRQSIVSA